MSALREVLSRLEERIQGIFDRVAEYVRQDLLDQVEEIVQRNLLDQFNRLHSELIHQPSRATRHFQGLPPLESDSDEGGPPSMATVHNLSFGTSTTAAREHRERMLISILDPATNSQALDLATNAQATETIVRNRIGPPTTQNEVYNDSTYGVLTQSTHHTPQVYYGIGAWRRGVPPHPERTYRPPREIPLSSADACRCNHYAYEHAIHRIHDNYGAPQRTYNTIHRYRVRRHIFRTSAFSRATDRQLVEMRQARALAGLDVSGYDVEITSRILADPAAWGIVGREMRRRGWVDDVITEGTRLLPLDPL
ncbi:hypothetical protein BU23DRAFT_314577 [Bimuria novae-zelandiae CBS 107.79]|uniref:Uncharacterized protein n=1 Tax=Bimuria novae-zelandiae CBS 107.79 TaxID=1447943 RepID=A0A6A5UQD7_9PLEO|nr:hypothetical protein BU23DRAFT_314577 [Bimuria novae-zelandiae CBS 107.79]